MGKQPTFTEAELKRAMKFATENAFTVRVIKRPNECEITFVPVDPKPEPPKGGQPGKW